MAKLKKEITVYHATQAAALIEAEHYAKAKGYTVNYEDRIWTEHVQYGHTVKYSFPLTLDKTQNMAKFWLHIQLYRMGNGGYELNCYLS